MISSNLTYWFSPVTLMSTIPAKIGYRTIGPSFYAGSSVSSSCGIAVHVHLILTQVIEFISTLS